MIENTSLGDGSGSLDVRTTVLLRYRAVGSVSLSIGLINENAISLKGEIG